MNRFEDNGFIQSKLSDTDRELDIKAKGKLPDTYTYDIVIDNVKNQGGSFKCVAYTLSYILELQNKLNGEDIKMDIDNLYSKRENKNAIGSGKNGMSIKNALNIIRHDGYKHNKGISHIEYYARLGSELAMKYSLIANGPFIFALPVCDTPNEEFWKGGSVIGGHAIACVGYNEEGFILLNSAGGSYGDYGKVTLPYSDLNRVLEAWAMIL